MSSGIPPNKGPQETAADAHKDASQDVPPTKTTGIAPEDDDFFRTFRRFTDYHFSHMMQSVFGLPSMYTPPPTSGWMVFEEGSDGSWQRPRPDRIMSEIQKKEAENAAGRTSVDRAGSEADSSDAEKRVRPARFYILRDPFGFGPEHFGTAGRTSSFGYPGGFTAVRAIPLPPQSVLDDPASRDAFFQHHKNQIYNDPFFNSGMGLGIDSLFYSPFSTFLAHRSFFGPPPPPLFWGFGFPYHHHIPWEAFPPPGRRMISNGEDNKDEAGARQDSPGINLFKEIAKIENESKEGETAAKKNRKLVSTSAITVTTLGADGVMHTKYALRKKFSDGTEEVEEREYDDQGHGPWGLLKDGEQRFKQWTKRGEEGFRELAKEGETAWKNVWDKGKEVLEELTGGKEGGDEGKR